MARKPNSEKNIWQRVPVRWRVFGMLVLLLLASYFVRSYWPYSEGLRSGQSMLSLPELRVGTEYVQGTFPTGLDARVEGVTVSRLEPTGREIRLAYEVLGSEHAGTPILLIHGAAADSRQLGSLAQFLKANRKVILVDLPGCGASERDVEDYSIEVSAGTLFELLDALGVPEVHVLGFGMGGGVAIYMSSRHPDRIASLGLAGSVGAQEYELLGNHIVNKIVYTFHLGAFKLMQDVFPHFGLMDRGNVNKQFARVLWDSDISDLAQFLRSWNGPAFIAHGQGDLQSTFSTAEYSLQLMPQAVSYFVPGGHSSILEDGGEALSAAYASFLGRLSDPLLLRASPVPADEPFPPISTANGARILMLMLIILVCTFVAEDPTCLAAGLLVAQGLIGFVPACVACLVGIFIGDLALYLVGRFLGRSIVRTPPFKWIVSEQQIDEMSERFSKNPKGLALIVTSRFIPGSRVPTFIAAGIMKLDWHKLFILFFIAAALWTPPLILLAEKVGGGVIERFKEWHHNAAWLVIGAILALYLLTHYIIPSFTWRGRRHHVMLRRKLTRHSNWPEFVLRLPVIAQYLWLSFVYRSFSLFTLVNRGLGDTGGLPAGSKYETYQKLFGNNAFARERGMAVKTILLEEEKNLERRFETALSLLEREKIAFPCVAKPELGEGGIGVMICKTAAELKAWLAANIDRAILQEYAGGEEYEVLWMRRPRHETGTIRSVIQKDFVVVKGDGDRNLEDLIWADDRSVNNGSLYGKLNFRNAMLKLKAGEPYALATAGTRIRGARYICKPGLNMEKLTAAIDALVDSMGRDIHFLLLDIRVPDEASLVSGTNLRVTSVKGAGATNTAIYDDFVRMGKAYAETYSQMHFCFSIGAEIREDRKLTPTIKSWRLLDIWSTAHSRSDNYVKLPE
ncbi:MAG: alpha/beta fold hydrolase [Opitutales bacterium]|nr:alpha/beta fold hydrolase [Opitutales bacterium]